MGEGLGEKIFYLTAKTIARTVAEEAFSILSFQGLACKTLTITAKETVERCVSARSRTAIRRPVRGRRAILTGSMTRFMRCSQSGIVMGGRKFWLRVRNGRSALMRCSWIWLSLPMR